MNVLALVTFRVYPPLMGGQKGVALFYRYLSQHHKIVMAAPAGNAAEDSENILLYPCLFANRKMVLNLFRLRRLKRLIQQHGIECIIAEHSYTGWLAYWLKRRTGVPFILHSHNLEGYRFRQMQRWWWRLYGQYEKWIHRRADDNFFISEEDKKIAVEKFGLEKNRCSMVTYGVEPIPLIPGAKKIVRKQWGVQNERLLFFNGTLDYPPNIEAVEHIVRHIIPLLKQQSANFKILLSGNRMTAYVQQLIDATSDIIYTGYVADINLYYQGADLFINSVVNSSGVKTKVIEALANHCTVVSAQSGAAGIPQHLCGEKLVTIKDYDWTSFAKAIVGQKQKKPSLTPPEFYQYYNWNNIAAKAASHIADAIAS